MSTPTEEVTPGLLRGWGLPDPGDSKKTRGQVMVVGGSLQSPGAVLLSGEAALRVGAGRVGLVVGDDVARRIGASMPEAGVYPLPAAGRPLEAVSRDSLSSADAVLLGTGFSDPLVARAALVAVADAGVARLVLDAFALGILAEVDRELLPRDLVINANAEEAAILLQRDLGRDRVADVLEIAGRFDAVAHCYGVVASPDGRTWRIAGGGPGLGTAGSGDVLAGAIAGFIARGADTAQAVVRGSWAHARAGDRLTARLGLGFLARELLPELTAAAAELA